MCKLRYLSVSGSPRAMGEAQGEAYREEIAEFVATREQHLLEYVRKYHPSTRADVALALRTAEELLNVHGSYDEALWQEFQGIARAAGVTEAELLIGNVLTDVRDLVLMRSLREAAAPRTAGEEGSEAGPGGDDGGCTTFGATPEATGGSSIIGQTWDMHPDARQYLVVVRRKPTGRPATLSLTTVGCLCLSGMNDGGVGVCTSNLVPTDAGTGVGYLFTISRALSARDARDAAGIISRTPRLSGHDFIVADHREVLDVEATAAESRTTKWVQGVRVHSNHYLDDSLREYAFDGIDLSSSEWRKRHLDEAFRRAARPLDASTCWNLLADARRGAGAVCNEDYEGRFGESATAATVVLSPSAGTMLACAGGARLGEQRRFEL